MNYDLFFLVDEYVYWIGWIGCVEVVGEVILFVLKDNFKNLCMIESCLGYLIECCVVEGFELKKFVLILILNYVFKYKCVV